MSNNAATRIAAPASIFDRLVSLIESVLSTNARIAHRNGDLPYFGL
jgi:hypothetical protein